MIETEEGFGGVSGSTRVAIRDKDSTFSGG